MNRQPAAEATQQRGSGRKERWCGIRLDASLEFRAWEEQGGELQVGEGVAGGGALKCGMENERHRRPQGPSHPRPI